VPDAAATLARLDAIMTAAAVNGAGSEGADELAPGGWRPR
jgi:hypothetical protein